MSIKFFFAIKKYIISVKLNKFKVIVMPTKKTALRSGELHNKPPFFPRR